MAISGAYTGTKTIFEIVLSMVDNVEQDQDAALDRLRLISKPMSISNTIYANVEFQLAL
jgi:hypothetical protein